MTVDLDKVRQKLDYIREALEHLRSIRDQGEDRFFEDAILRAAALRFLQTALEALFDSAHHLVAREQVGLPQTYRETVDCLAELDLLSADDLDTLRRMAGFRNRVVHVYLEVDPREVWRILEEHLGDFERFREAVARRYLGPPPG